MYACIRAHSNPSAINEVGFCSFKGKHKVIGSVGLPTDWSRKPSRCKEGGPLILAVHVHRDSELTFPCSLTFGITWALNSSFVIHLSALSSLFSGKGFYNYYQLLSIIYAAFCTAVIFHHWTLKQMSLLKTHSTNCMTQLLWDSCQRKTWHKYLPY